MLQLFLKWYLEAARHAGREVCETGHISPDTQTTLSQPLMPDIAAFIKMANANWDRLLAH